MLLLQGRISLPPPAPPQNMTLCVIGPVRFERNCGKMYSRHLFPYGGFTKLDQSLQRLAAICQRQEWKHKTLSYKLLARRSF